MSFLEDMIQMASGGSDPRSQILQALAAPQPQQASPQPVSMPQADVSTPPVMNSVEGQPGLSVPVPPPRPAGLTDDQGNVLPPQAAQMQASASVPAPLAPVPGGGNPPDLTALYEKLQRRQESMRMFENGLNTFVAAYSTPAMASALMGQNKQAGEASPGDSLGTLLKLQGLQQANTQRAAQLTRLPAIAKQLGISQEYAQQLFDSGKLDEVLAAIVKPNKEFVKLGNGQYGVGDKNAGSISLPIGSSDVTNPATPDKAPDWQLKQSDIIANPAKYGINPADPNAAAQIAALVQKAAVPGGQTINVGGSQTAMDKARADMQAEDMGGYNNANTGLSTVAAFREAIKQGGDDIMTGPQAPAYLKAKEALGGAFGIQLPGVGPSEVMQLLGTQLATQASKEISTRPAAVEWQKILTVKPGIENSPEGTMAKLNLMEQQLQAKRELAVRASHYTGNDWIGEKEKWYAAHPFKSPFDPTQDLSKADTVRALGAPTPLPETIAMLKRDPSKAAQFDEFYGRGAAAKVLGSN